MAVETVVDVASDSFEQLIKGSQLPVMVYFWAEWCLPCKIISPLIDEIAAEYEGKLKIFKLDSDSCKDVVKQYKVFSVPTVMFFRGGIETERMIGSKHRDEFEKVLQRNL